MDRNSLVVLEASKVGRQHITLLNGYLKALRSADVAGQSVDLVFASSLSTFQELMPDVRAGLSHERIFVMDPEKRRLAIKVLVEFFICLRYIVRKRADDILLITCLLPPALILVEVVNRLLRRRGVFVVLHGEIEGLVDPSLRNIRSYGFWIWQWLKMRRAESQLQLVVIDDFIKTRLLADFPDKFHNTQIHVIPHPITAFTADVEPRPVPRVCFIGYRTRFKGFEDFVTLAKSCPDVEFIAVGGGKIENVITGVSAPIRDMVDFLGQIACCVAAVFPYQGGYDVSLSAAALDAVSTGVPILATERPCFMSLAEHFGPDSVVLCQTPEALKEAVERLSAQSEAVPDRRKRLIKLESSKYSTRALTTAFLDLIQSVRN